MAIQWQSRQPTLFTVQSNVVASISKLTLRDGKAANGDAGTVIEGRATRVLDLHQPGQRLDFLGYTFRQDRDQYGRPQLYWNLVPSRKAVARERDALRGMTNRHQSHTPLPELIGRVNR